MDWNVIKSFRRRNNSRTDELLPSAEFMKSSHSINNINTKYRDIKFNSYHVILVVLVFTTILLFIYNPITFPIPSNHNNITRNNRIITSTQREFQRGNDEYFADLVRYTVDVINNKTVTSDSIFDQSTSSALQQYISTALVSAKMPQMRICILTNDFTTSSHAGGTATAYHLMSVALAKHQHFRVKIVVIASPDENLCNKRAVEQYNKQSILLECLESKDFTHRNRTVVYTSPYDETAFATVQWVKQHQHECDVIHFHEWGGHFGALALYLLLESNNYRRPITVVEPHGGHLWSQQGALSRPNDIFTLRIDNAEKHTTQFANFIVSPSRYMLSYLATRGWDLRNRYVIPNVVQDANRKIDHNSKPVSTLCFFGRLEERKGIKLFSDALDQLQSAVLAKVIKLPPQFSVWFVGSDSEIDYMASTEWISARSKEWTSWNTVLHVNKPRDEALALIKSNGVMLVLPSLIENLPYVVAEAIVNEIPLLTFDTGGVREALQVHTSDKLTVVPSQTAQNLYSHILTVLKQGRHMTSKLSSSIRTAEQQWSDWHTALQISTSVTREMFPTRHTPRKQKIKLQIVTIPYGQKMLTSAIYNSVCKAHDILPGSLRKLSSKASTIDAVLILPEQFQYINTTVAVETFQKLLAATTDSQQNSIGAFTFGVEIDSTSFSFAQAPTWVLYSRDGSKCELEPPLLISRDVLCSAFAVDVHTFREYHTYLLSLVLSMHKLQIVTYPDVLFEYKTGFTIDSAAVSQSACDYGEKPASHVITSAMHNNLHNNIVDDMLQYHYVTEPDKTLITSLDNTLVLPMSERLISHSFVNGSLNGWKLGFINDNGDIDYYAWNVLERVFTCQQSTHEHNYGIPSRPYVYTDDGAVLVLPCKTASARCCDNSVNAVSLLRYEMFDTQSVLQHLKKVQLTFYAALNKECTNGDGVSISLVGYSGTQKWLLHQSYISSATSKAQNVLAHDAVTIEAVARSGDLFDIIIDPLQTNTCDETEIKFYMYDID